MVVGVYKAKIERLRAEKVIGYIKRKSKEPVEIEYIDSILADEHDEVKSLNEALRKKQIDIALVDMSKLVDAISDGVELVPEVSISGIVKRQDARQVLVTKKKKNEIVPNALVLIKKGEDVEQFKNLYDNIRCREEDRVSTMLKLLSCDLCDAFLVPADDLRALKMKHLLGYRYNYFDYKDFVPPHARAVYATISRDDSYIELSREISHVETAECFELEAEIIKRINNLIYVKDCQVYAGIEKGKYRVCAYVSNDKGYCRVEVKEPLDRKNLLIRKVVDRIKEKM